jgi:hypothetical protein
MEKQQGILLFSHNGRDWPGKYKRFNGHLLNSSKVATYETVF